MPHPQRQSPRLQDYDYAQAGAYFITICAHERHLMFGHIADDAMTLGAAGVIAERHWTAIPGHFPHVELDAFVVMPNHVHGILVFSDVTASEEGVPRTGQCPVPTDTPSESPARAISTVVGSYKSIVTREIRRATQTQVTVWQGRFHDHII